VIIDSQTGIVFTNNGTFVTESSFWPQLWLGMNVIPKPVAPVALDSENTYVLIPSNGFYHSLIEDLPMVLRQIPDDKTAKLLIYESAPSYILDFAQLLGLPVVRVPRYIKIQKFSFLQKNSDVGWPHPQDIDLLRSYFLTVDEGAARNHLVSNKVYVSRLNSTRSPKFEAQLTRELNKRGWKIIHSENLSLSDQIELFANAAWVAGVHGAGLSGMVWMNRGSRVTELGPIRFVPCYSRLASILAHNYQRIEFLDCDESLSDILNVLI
jgi:capsular polysaccharide biosynthesis protein